MNPTSISHIVRRSKLGRRFTIITVMFLSVLLGMLVYTITTINKEKSNARLIDVAGRQRMLLQKHMSEVFLTSQGINTNYTVTRELIRSSLNALKHGGSIVLDPKTGQSQTIPAVPTQAISFKLHEQQQHFDKIADLADHFLLLSLDHPEFHQTFQTLRAQNSTLIGIADDAVKQLNSHSEENIATMVKWESLIALFVALLGGFVTTQGIRASKKLEKEITERERIQTKLKRSQLFLDSIVENIPNMVFVKDAKTLRFVLINKASESLSGYSRDKWIGKNDYALFPKDQADFFTKKDGEVLASREFLDIPDEIMHTKHRGLRHLHTKKIPLLDQDGDPQYLLGIAEDITERVQADDALRKSEERYRALYEDNPSMYFTVSQHGKILSVNEFGSQQLGYLGKELVGQRVIDLFLEVDRPQVQQHFEACLRSPLTVFSWEFRKVRKDGSVLWVKEAARAVHNMDGEIVVLIVCEDISERKNTEKALQEWKALTESILGQLPKGFAYRCLNDKNWTIVYASDGIEEITGFPVSDFFSGKITYDALMAPGENERVWPIIQDALAKRLPYENEHQIITRDGKTKWILARGNFIFDDTGKLLYLDGLNVDITEYKNIENKLRTSEARFRSLVEHVPFCIHEIELDGRISSLNRAGQEMTGVANESQMIGRSYLELAEKSDHERIRKYFAQATQGQPVDFEFTVTTHGKMKFYTKSFIPIRVSDGRVSKIVGISEDITERKVAEEHLRESETKRIEALSQSDALKSALLSSVSHELRTPLTAIKTSVSGLIENTPSSKATLQQDLLNGIDQEIDHMSHLVSNLLDMSQIEAGTLTPQREWHPLEDLVEGALRRTALTLETRNIEVHIPDDIPPVFVDAVEMQQVLINLLDNAVKYSSPDSPIRFCVRTGMQHIEVEISNTGEPIQEKDLERIFERFYRHPSLRKQPVRGNGLGLAICKGIVEAHGGRIWADSIDGKMTITFTVPVIESMASFSLEGLHKL